MSEREREREEGSQLISCITAVISTPFITSSMCSARFKIFKSVICQHYEVNTHSQDPLSYPSPRSLTPHGPRIHHRDLTWPFVVRAGKDFCGLCLQFLNSGTDMLPDPGEKLRGMRAARERESGGKKRKKKKSKEEKLRAAKHEEASNCFPGVCDPVTLEEFFLVLLLRVNQHSLLIWWHRRLHNTVL